MQVVYFSPSAMPLDSARLTPLERSVGITIIEDAGKNFRI